MVTASAVARAQGLAAFTRPQEATQQKRAQFTARLRLSGSQEQQQPQPQGEPAREVRPVAAWYSSITSANCVVKWGERLRGHDLGHVGATRPENLGRPAGTGRPSWTRTLLMMIGSRPMAQFQPIIALLSS